MRIDAGTQASPDRESEVELQDLSSRDRPLWPIGIQVLIMRSCSACARLAVVVGVLCLLLSKSTLAQQPSCNATVPIRAVVRGSISLSVRTAPVSLELHPSEPTRNSALVPVSVQWNLNPAEVRGFELIGYFADPLRALTNHEYGFDLTSDHVLGRVDSGSFKYFSRNDPLAPAGESLSLLNEQVFPGHARGQHTAVIQLRVDDSVPGLPQGRYEGVLHIEVRHY